MSADFTPGISPYKETGTFRFWCQKVLPLVYDDSLSYYELLCKVVNYLNDVIGNVDGIRTDTEALRTAYIELQDYVNSYFDNLDVQEEINNKLDDMAANGSLTELIVPLLPDLISAWLSDHITPTTPVIDSTLTISGAGADAKVTGDKITAVNDLIKRYNFALYCSGNQEITFNTVNKTIFCNFTGFIFDNKSYFNMAGVSTANKTIDYTENISGTYVVYFNQDSRKFEEKLVGEDITAARYAILGIYWFNTLTDIKRIWEFPEYDKTLTVQGKFAEAYETGKRLSEAKYIETPFLDYDLTDFLANKQIYSRSISSYHGDAGTSYNFKGFASRTNASGIGKIDGVKINRIAIYSTVENHSPTATAVIMDDSRNIIAQRQIKIPYSKCNKRDTEYNILLPADLTEYDNVYIGLYVDLSDVAASVNGIESVTPDTYCTAETGHTNLYLRSTDTAPNWRTVLPANAYAVSVAYITDAWCSLNSKMNNLKFALDVSSGALKADKDSKTLNFTETALLFFSGQPGYNAVSDDTSYDLSTLTVNAMHEFGIKNGQITYIGNNDYNYVWEENEAFLCRVWIDGNFNRVRIFSFLPNNKVIDSDTTNKFITKRKAGIILPEKFYGLTGDLQYFYTENAISNYKILGRYDFSAARQDGNIKDMTNEANTIAPRISFSYTGSNTITFALKDYLNDTAEEKTVAIRTAPKTENASCKIIVVADSFRRYTYGAGILKYIEDFAAADNMEINMLGSINTLYGVPSEARGGWTETDYYTHYVPVAQRDPSAPTEEKKMPSPFVFSDDDTVEHAYFSFAKYLQTYNIATPDIVMFALGNNYDGHKGSYINAMIADIHNYNPDIKIIVSLVPSNPKNRNGNYFTSKDIKESQNLSYLTLFENRENENIYLCAEHMAIDGNLGVQGEPMNVNPTSISSGDEIIEWHNTGIHPTAMGAWCIAKLNYEVIGYVMQQ